MPQWRRLDAQIRLHIALGPGGEMTDHATLDRLVVDRQTVAEQTPQEVLSSIALAEALTARGRWLDRTGERAGATAQWAPPRRLLAHSADPTPAAADRRESGRERG